MSKPVWLVADVLKHCGVPMPECIAQMLCKKPVVPDTPKHNYIRIADTDIYCRIFEQGDIAFSSGGQTGAMTVEFDLDKDFADAREVCGSDTLPTEKHHFTFEGQTTESNTQWVQQYSTYPTIWGMWGASGAETIYLAVLRGGYNPKGSAMNYYLPLVTCDGVLFESTNQTTAYIPVSELTVYER